MSILLTGATGFVGCEVAKLKKDFRCVVRSGGTYPFMDVYTIAGIDASTEWSNCFHGVDSIIHLAGLAHNKSFSEAEYKSVNVDGTLRLALKAVEGGVKRFVFVSSIGVNGALTCSHQFSADSIPNPHNFYAKSKYEAELGLSKISKETGLEVVIVRPTLVYGPNAPGNFGMLTKLIHKLPVLPFGLANNRRNFISVQNFADFLITCATHPNAGGHTFLASENETVSIKEFSDAIAKGLGKKVIQLPIPVGLMRALGKLIGKSSLIEQLFGNLEVNSANIQQVLGWTPPLTMEQSMLSLKYLGNKQ